MKIMRVILLLVLVFSLAGCQGKTTAPETTGLQIIKPTEGAEEIYQSPPALTLLYDGGVAGTHLGTYCWNYDKGDGTWSGICADALHPLDCQEYLQPISAYSLYAELQFADAPDSYTIRCWHDSQWGNYDADAEEIAHHGNVFELKPGGYIYEVIATWVDDGGAYHGTAHYAFYVTAGVYDVMPIDK